MLLREAPPLRSTTRRRRQQRWGWFIAAAAATLYLAGLGGATAGGFAAASLVRKAVSSKGFRDALHAARHPVTEADLKRLLPGVPIYPGSKVHPLLSQLGDSSPRGGTTMVVFEAPASPDKVVAFYRTRMAGWSVKTSQSGRRVTGLEFERGNASGLITVVRVPRPGLGGAAGTMVTIVYHSGDGGAP